MKLLSLITKILMILMVFSLFSGCKNHQESRTGQILTIFHAGSLSVPFREMADAFKKENPEMQINLESSGSVDAARKISDLHKSCDIIAVADYLVIDNLLIPEYTKWQFGFASNEMVIAYNDQSKEAGKIDSLNWYDLLQHEDLIIGRSDPNADPCGYRTIFMFKLAEKIQQKPGLADLLANKKNTVIRPKEVDLLSLLHSNNLDYLFIYRSVAIQHGLKYIELPAQLNLSDPELEELYKDVSVTVKGKQPGEQTEIPGSTILYSFSIPENAENHHGAKAFIRFLLDPEKGGKILEKNGMTVVRYLDPQYENSAPDFLVNP